MNTKAKKYCNCQSKRRASLNGQNCEFVSWWQRVTMSSQLSLSMVISGENTMCGLPDRKPYYDANLLVLYFLVFTSPIPSRLLPVLCYTDYKVYKSYYCYSTLTFQEDLLSLASYHAWNPCMHRCEQWCMFVPELTNMFAWPVIQKDAFPVMTCNQLFCMW